jgi:transforming growth factor-beta-induced protein
MMQTTTAFVIFALASVVSGFTPAAPRAFVRPSATSLAMADIVDTAVAAGSFGTLAAALGAAGLVDTLKGPGPFTVFAPTDEAFAKLPEGTVADLLKPENKAKLTSILTYHVLSGEVMAATVVTMDGAKVPTVNGASVTIGVKGGVVTVDDATVVTTDIKTDNGVIHVIDSVMIPK